MKKEHPYALNTRNALNRLVFQYKVKEEWLAIMCNVTPQAMSHYLNGNRPIPVHVAVLADAAFGGHELLFAMARMEGLHQREIA